MKKKHIFSGAALVALSIFAAGCSSDDTTPAYEDNNTLTTFTGGSEATNTEADTTATTRTGFFQVGRPKTLDLTIPFYFFWDGYGDSDYGDYVFVKDDNNTWKKSVNAATYAASGDFNLYGTFVKGGPYTVHYTGVDPTAKATEVTIKAQQDFVYGTVRHVGANGDCAFGTATKQADGKYKFTVTHKASYLFILPYTTDTQIQNKYRLDKITITSSGSNIAGTYDFSDGKLTDKQPTNNPSTTITVQQVDKKFGRTTADEGGLIPPTIMNHTGRTVSIVIAPGTHTLTLAYELVNTTDGKKIIFTKKYKAKQYKENTVYQMNPNFTLTNK